MADPIISSTVQVLLEKALSLAIDQIGLVFGFKQDLQRLKKSVEMIRAALADAEDKQRQSQVVQLWLKQLEGVALDAYYVLDELNYEMLRRKAKSRNQLKGKVCSFFFFSKDDISFRWRMASKVRDISTRLKSINQEAAEYGLIKMVPPQPPSTIGVEMSRQTDSIVAPIVVGRDKDESKIVEMLLNSSEEVLSVIPILGMGGLGKTTLAKSVYNNQQIHSRFNRRIWVCVSEKFEVTELFKLILGSLRGNKVEMLSRDDVVQQIRKELDGKRYLLVLDDIWNEVPQLWENFFDSLLGLSTAVGSKCLVTTRGGTVASIVSRHPAYKLGKLSNEECWSIIKEKAIGKGEIPEELNGIRAQVVKKCDGLPLAANVIGGLLRMKKKEDWPSIVENGLLSSNGDYESSIEQILKLSFDNLPSPSIKKCFAYCSLFEKEIEMGRDLLIELWMAEGFLQPDLQNEILMEEIGGKYLSILLQSSLLEEIEDLENCYKMHDLVHDLAQSISKLQTFHFEDDVINNITHQVRHLALHESAEIMTWNDGSALVLNMSSISNDMLWKFKHLHILNLSRAQINELPTSIGKLKHLRFLNISGSKIKSLPESICRLYNLHSLRMHRCNYLDGLPQGMNNLFNLRHLHCWKDDIRFRMPPEMRRLSCLQTLEFYNVGEEKGRQIEELGPLKYLKGGIEIRNLQLVMDKEGAERANLSEKKNLTKLKFYWASRDGGGVEIYDEQVLEGLKPHQDLKVLRIENFMGDRFPQWVSNMSKLVELGLVGCERCIELPALGHLPCLESLGLEKMVNLSCIGVSFYGLDACTSSSGGGQVATSRRKLFPSLKYLTLEYLESLIEWKEIEDSGDDVVFPVLENLQIVGCSQLATAPTHFPSVKELRISNVQVSVGNRILSRGSSTLETLILKGIHGLTRLSNVILGGCFNSLERLDLVRCPNFTELNLMELGQLEALRELVIRYCPELVQVAASQTTNKHLTSLKTFRISNCQGLTNITREMLEGCTSLLSLKVWRCPNLIAFQLDLQQTPSLSFIALYDCPKLFVNKNNMPRGFDHLTNLQDLSIGPFSNDDCLLELFDWCGLTSCSSTLRHLRLHHMESLLPDRLQHFTSLETLNLSGFGSLEALPEWFGSLASLKTLQLNGIQKLRYLPSLPAMRCLTKLQKIDAIECHLLKERCSPESGRNSDSEWSKISQLPNLQIHFY